MTVTATRVVGRLDRVSSGRFFLIALAPVLIVYLLTTTWTKVTSPDPFTNTVAAWKLGSARSIELDEYEPLGNPGYSGIISWIVDIDGHNVSKYPPGAVLLAAPLYALFPGELETYPPRDPRRWDGSLVAVPVPPLWQGALVAATTAALAVALAGLTVRSFVGSATALLGTFVYGFGTGAWGVASHDFWPHGPAMLWIALGIWLLTTEREWPAGLAFGAAVLTRPLTIVIPATAGAVIALRRGRWRPARRLAIGTAAGLAAVITFNVVAFGRLSVLGGYESDFIGRGWSTDVGWYLANVLRGLFDLGRGLFVWSPFLLLVLIAAPKAARRASSPVVGAALGGVVYILVLWKLNRFGGGGGFIGYRYPLEGIAAAAPLFLVAFKEQIATHRVWARVFLLTVVYSIVGYTAALL